MRKPILIAFLTLTVAALTGCSCSRTAAPRTIADATRQWTSETEQMLRDEANRLGVPLQTTPMVHYAQWGAAFYTAPAAGLEKVAPADFSRGVNLGVAYVDSPGQSFPAGYYSLRAFADPRAPGDVDGRLQIIDTGGKVAAEVPATLTVESMQVPAQTIHPVDVSVAAAKVNARYNGIHWTTYVSNAWALRTSGLVVPPPVATP
ncbi:MAG: hypothetical protein JO197_03315 [Acidobacteria bacterium]|nr:hypothetical protein [Acidobacteriota bacterium]MBV9476587.1 hypothetical protein [Acidobacteriota bacterium]